MFYRFLIVSSVVFVMLSLLSCKKDNQHVIHSSASPSSSIFQYFNTSNSGLLSDSVLSLFPYNNQLFIGTARGLSVYSSTFTHYTISNSGLPDNHINCCYITDSVWWIGTNAGLVKYSVASQQWQTFTKTNSPLPNNKIRSISIDKNGKVWIGTFTGGGVVSLDGTNWQVFTPSNSSLPSSSVAKVFTQDSLYWFGTGGGLARYNGVQWTIYNPGNSGLQSAWIYDITEGSNASQLFIATNNGINIFNILTNSWSYYNSTNSGLIGNFTRKLYFDKMQNILWIVTDGNGLFKWDFSNFIQYKYTGIGSLPSNYLTDLCWYNGKLWIATKESGLVVMK